jgi:hypothetical protein
MEASWKKRTGRACAIATSGGCGAALAVSLAMAAFSASAQQSGSAEPAPRTARAEQGSKNAKPSAPTPRLPNGTVDLGGDGIWQLPWITDFGKVLVDRKDIPFLPWTKAMYDYNQATHVAYDPEGFCLPPGGPRMFGTPYPAQFLQEPDRIVVIFEGGAHVWREIHMDGRPLPDPKDITPTYFGYSVGHWDGDTLVVDTVGFNEKSWLNFGGYMHTDQMRTVERISRPNLDTLHYEATIDDPGAYSEPWTVAWDIPWTAGQDLAEYICQENNQFLLKLKDDFGQPFFEDQPVNFKDAFAK